MKFNTISVVFLLLFSTIIWSQNTTSDSFKTKNGNINIKAILHSSFVLTHNNKTIYVDPYGGAKLYEGLKSPDIVLITDIHGDHLNQETLDGINTSNSIFIVPEVGANKLPEKYSSQIVILKNGQGIHRLGFFIKAIAMYNLPEEPDSKHPKGRGNGYILTIDDKQVYISGDTEDIPEMRILQNIDIAFICMNLPYTMTINQAANAVLKFKPKVVYPFHYRGKDGFSDVNEFKKLVNAKNSTIDVRLKKWYPNN